MDVIDVVISAGIHGDGVIDCDSDGDIHSLSKQSHLPIFVLGNFLVTLNDTFHMKSHLFHQVRVEQ